MSTNRELRETLRSFRPEPSPDIVAVYVNTSAPDDAPEPWYVESVIGWAVVDIDDEDEDGLLSVIRPVVSGDTPEWQDTSYIGVYRRDDLLSRHIRDRLLETCAAARANRERGVAALIMLDGFHGCGAPS
jgi:hypothetical protein